MRPLGPQIPAQHPALERKDAYNGRIRFYGLRDRLKTLVNPRHRRVIRHYVKQMLVLSLGSVDRVGRREVEAKSVYRQQLSVMRGEFTWPPDSQTSRPNKE